MALATRKFIWVWRFSEFPAKSPASHAQIPGSRQDICRFPDSRTVVKSRIRKIPFQTLNIMRVCG